MEREELLQALRNADAAGDTAAAQRLAQLISETPAAKSPETAKQERTLGQTIYENVIGSGEVDTPGERLGQYIRGGTAAVARGIADVPALPANLAQLGAMGVEKAFGMEEPSMVSRGLAALPDTREMLGAVPVIGPESEYVAPGTAGEFISTAGEFAGGAGASAGPRAMLRYGVAPGVTSEAAGQATEGMDVEPYARAVTGLGTSLLAAPRSAKYTRGAGPDELEMANRLGAAGVKPTAGQLADSPSLMRAEGTSGPTGEQLEGFTRATLRSAGNTVDKRATAPALRRTQNNITKGMNDILKDVDVPITTDLGQRTLSVADDYFAGSAGNKLPPSLRRINDSLLDVSTQPGGVSKIPASDLRKWRTTAGIHTTSREEMTRAAAHALRDLIDDASEAALTSLGRADDIDKLGVLRNQYRNFLTIADASTKGGRQGARGILTPERVSSASTRTVGKINRATGKGTDLTELANDALAMIGAAPTTEAGALRRVALGVGGGAGSGAAIGSFMGGGIPGAMIGAGVGATAPLMVQGLARNPLVQNLLTNPSALTQSAPVLPGLLSQ
tara:strand:+ start:203 stop:1885 length:1683 start_codon:yes stop_codon:yes gene_type:complete